MASIILDDTDSDDSCNIYTNVVKKNFNLPPMVSHTDDTDSDDYCDIYTNVVKKNFDAEYSSANCKIRDYEALLKKVDEPSFTEEPLVEPNPRKTYQQPVTRSTTRATRATRALGRRRGRQNSNRFANNPPVACVDLDSLPDPQARVAEPVITGPVISLDDSDGEVVPKSEEKDCKLSIKVMWRSQDLQRIPIRKHETMSVMFDHFAKYENVPHKNLLFLLRGRITVTPTDTPASLGLTIADIIDGGVLTNREPALDAAVEDCLEFKLQRKGGKQTIDLTIGREDKLLVLITKCAEQLKVPTNKLKLTFDGDMLDVELTAGDQDLDGGECLDLHITE